MPPFPLIRFLYAPLSFSLFLPQLLNDEKDRSKTSLEGYNKASLELSLKDNQIIELQRKYEDTGRAYQQMKSEKEARDKRIVQMEKSAKVCPNADCSIYNVNDSSKTHVVLYMN